VVAGGLVAPGQLDAAAERRARTRRRLMMCAGTEEGDEQPAVVPR
jgi:hypothetical protein